LKISQRIAGGVFETPDINHITSQLYLSINSVSHYLLRQRPRS